MRRIPKVLLLLLAAAAILFAVALTAKFMPDADIPSSGNPPSGGTNTPPDDTLDDTPGDVPDTPVSCDHKLVYTYSNADGVYTARGVCACGENDTGVMTNEKKTITVACEMDSEVHTIEFYAGMMWKDWLATKKDYGFAGDGIVVGTTITDADPYGHMFCHTLSYPLRVNGEICHSKNDYILIDGNYTAMRCVHEYENSVCVNCKATCVHSTYVDGVCKNCGKVCEHEMSDNTCTICGLVCDHTLTYTYSNAGGVYTAEGVCKCGEGNTGVLTNVKKTFILSCGCEDGPHTIEFYAGMNWEDWMSDKTTLGFAGSDVIGITYGIGGNRLDTPCDGNGYVLLDGKFAYLTDYIQVDGIYTKGSE